MIIAEDTRVMFDINITHLELSFCLRSRGLFNSSPNRSPAQNNMFRFSEMGGQVPSNEIDTIYTFHGERTRTKFLFSLKMYSDEVGEWIKDHDKREIECSFNKNLGIQRRRTFSCSY